MYIQAIDRGFVVMTELFGYVIEAVFTSEIVEFDFEGRSFTLAVPREIMVHDSEALNDWIQQSVLRLIEGDVALQSLSRG